MAPWQSGGNDLDKNAEIKIAKVDITQKKKSVTISILVRKLCPLELKASKRRC